MFLLFCSSDHLPRLRTASSRTGRSPGHTDALLPHLRYFRVLSDLGSECGRLLRRHEAGTAIGDVVGVECDRVEVTLGDGRSRRGCSVSVGRWLLDIMMQTRAVLAFECKGLESLLHIWRLRVVVF